MSRLEVIYRYIPDGRKYFLLLACVALLLGGASSVSGAQSERVAPAPEGAGLFRETAAKASAGTQREPIVGRSRLVTVDLSPFANAQGAGAATFSLNLFPDASFTAIRDSARTNPSGSIVWVGHLQGVNDGYVTLVVNGGVIVGNVNMPGAAYEVRYAGNGVHIVYKVNPGGYPPEHTEGDYEHEEQQAQEAMRATLKGAVYPAAMSGTSASSAPYGPSMLAQVDLIILWTPKAATTQGGAEAAAAEADLAVEEANNAYARSGVDIHLNLLYRAQTNYVETLSTDAGAYQDDLTRITDPSDGIMDEAHTLRELYHADAVSLLIDNAVSCGRAWQLRDPADDFDELAFSVVHMPCAAGNFSLAHELGHNMGSLHDRANSAPTADGAYEYSYGYQDPVGGFSTIMAYPLCPAPTPCPRVGHFSNPNVLYNGRPTGKPSSDPLSADNAQSLNNTRNIAAGWRTGGPVATATPTPPTPPGCDIAFQDVPAGSTYYDSVRCLSCRNILSGYPCGGPGEACGSSGDPYFRVNSNITRGQIAKVVSNAANFSNDPGGQMFEDVPASSPFFTWVNRLARLGHMSGYACGGPGETCGAGSLPYFRPNDNASRGQLSKIVSNAAGFAEAHTEVSFEDVPTTSPFYVWIERLSSRGYISGYGCGGAGEPCQAASSPYFRPSNKVTRGQASKIVANTFYPACATPARP